MFVCLIIAFIPACIAFLGGATDKPVQSIATSTVVQSTPASGLSIPLSSRIALQPTLPADAQPQTTILLLPHPTLQSVPTPTPTSAKITVLITSLGSFQCAQVLFRGQRLGNAVTADDLKNNRNTITGTVTSPGMFSVNFYATNDCSGKRGNYIRTQTMVDTTYACDGSKRTDVCMKTQ